jgi:hypothetical protein
VTDVAVDPADSKSLYAAANGSFWKSSDAGQTWTQLEVRTNRTGKWITEVEISPSGELFLGYGTAFRGDPGGVLKSTDGGASWTESYVGLQVWALAIAQSDPARIYLSTGNGVLTSPDNGKTWHSTDSE